ncbi:MAG: OB-fold domain-containing protein [Rhodospirillaceae bacterium]|nr:OB-fold domain-containing protein [Rhodospirillaceae bacterium]
MPDRLAPGAAGTLVTFTVIRKAPAAFAADGLYAVAIVDLAADGRRVIGRVEPFDPPPALNAPVRLARYQGAIPVFAPA